MCKICKTGRESYCPDHQRDTIYKEARDIVKEYTGEFPCKMCGDQIVAMTKSQDINIDAAILKKLYRNYIVYPIGQKKLVSIRGKMKRKESREKKKQTYISIKHKRISKRVNLNTNHVAYEVTFRKQPGIAKHTTKTLNTLDEAIAFRDQIESTLAPRRLETSRENIANCIRERKGITNISYEASFKTKKKKRIHRNFDTLCEANEWRENMLQRNI